MRLGVTSILVFLLVICSGTLLAADHYVNAESGSDSNSGASPENAWATITHALSAVICSPSDPASIHVAAGTYSASTNGESFPLQLRSFMMLQGEGPDATILDAEQAAPHVILLYMATELAIEGITITGGDASGDQADGMGGGMLCQMGSTPVIRNCRISGNKAVQGGGMYILVAAPHIVDCEIVQNTVKGKSSSGGKSLGGGIFSLTSFPTIERCMIADNAAEPGPGLSAGGSGGGIYMVYMELVARDYLRAFPEGTLSDSADVALRAAMAKSADATPEIIDCEVLRNTCSGPISTGGGISCLNVAPRIALCQIMGNSVTKGGGGVAWVVGDIEMRMRRLLDEQAGVLENCEISDNTAQFGAGVAIGDASPTIKNCLLAGNVATGNGGAFEFEAPRGVCAPALANCTVADNRAGSSSGSVANWWGAAPTFENCILWGNGDEHILIESGSVGLDYSCVQGGWVGGSDISSDPLFVSGPLGDYYLSCQAAGQDADSPCIDSGSDTAEALGLDKLTTRTDGVPDASNVDMGYHYTLALGQNPRIECSLNQGQFSTGELLVASLEAQNEGPDAAVDVYVGFILPDGSILCYTGDGFIFGLASWLEGVTLPQGFNFGPTPIFELTIPGGATAGNYIYAAALTKPGLLEFIGEASLFEFALSE